MYLKRIEGKRAVTLPDGTILTRSDLPPPDTSRWVASRKAVVVRAVTHGLISPDEAMQRYGLSAEEFATWVRQLDRHGLAGLKVTKKPQI